MIRKIISGGQTGADQGALQGARLAGVATGGWAPYGWITEDGPSKKLLQSYNLSECGYGFDCSFHRVVDSDATLVVCHRYWYVGRVCHLPATGGSKLAATYCTRLHKPLYQLAWPSDYMIGPLANWILTNEIKVLNVAGNRESKNPGIQSAVETIILKLCGAVNA